MTARVPSVGYQSKAKSFRADRLQACSGSGGEFRKFHLHSGMGSSYSPSQPEGGNTYFDPADPGLLAAASGRHLEVRCAAAVPGKRQRDFQAFSQERGSSR
jgi:hypothetical protein